MQGKCQVRGGGIIAALMWDTNDGRGLEHTVFKAYI